MLDPASMLVPITLPELGAGSQPIRISAWFVDVGDWVDVDESVLEVLVGGITCEITAPASGRVNRLAKDLDTVIVPGDVLGWIDPVTPGDGGKGAKAP